MATRFPGEKLREAVLDAPPTWMEDSVTVGAEEHPGQDQGCEHEQAAKLDTALPPVSGGVIRTRLQAAACHVTFGYGSAGASLLAPGMVRDDEVNTQFEVRSVELFQQRRELPHARDRTPGRTIDRLIVRAGIKVHGAYRAV